MAPLSSLKFKPSQFKNPFRFVYSHKSGVPISKQPVQLQNFTPLKPKQNEVLVRMLASPINPSDLNMIEGSYGTLQGMPNGGAQAIHGDAGEVFVAGSEGVGVIEEVGEGVSEFRVGQRVIPAKPAQGTWSSHITGEAANWMPVDEDIPLEYAATIAVNPCTAYRLLEDFGSHLQEGDTIVQNGATSMVGYAVTQLARDKGLNVINIIRNSPDEAGTQNTLNELGASVTVSTEFARTKKMRDLIKELPAPKLGLNGVGGDQMRTVTSYMANDSPVVTYGGMSRRPVTLTTSDLVFRNLQFQGFWLSRWVLENSKEDRQKMLDQIADKIKSKKLVLFMETWKASEFDLAYDEYYNAQRRRKQVLLFDQL